MNSKSSFVSKRESEICAHLADFVPVCFFFPIELFDIYCWADSFSSNGLIISRIRMHTGKVFGPAEASGKSSGFITI